MTLGSVGEAADAERRRIEQELRKSLRVSDQISLPEPVPEGYFSNDVLSVAWVNRLAVLLARVVALMLQVVVQAQLQSASTKRARELYHKFVASRPKSESKSQDQVATLGLPERSRWWVRLLLLVEYSICVRVTLVRIFLLYTHKRVMLTVSNKLDTICNQVGELAAMPLNYSLATGNLERALQLAGSAADRAQASRCYSGLVDFLARRYGEFLFWNASDTFDGISFLDDYLFVENSHAVQMYSIETQLFAQVISVLVLCCAILGSISVAHYSYDVIPLLFIYDPTFCAHRALARLRHHLHEARISFANYWSIYRLRQDCSLGAQRTKGDFLGEHLQNAVQDNLHHRWDAEREKGQSAAGPPAAGKGPRRKLNISPEVISLRQDQYEHYVTDHHGHNPRRILLILSPPSAVAYIVTISTSVVFLFYIFVKQNEPTSDLNRELASFLTKGSQAGGLNVTMLEAAQCLAPGPPLLDTLRDDLASYLQAYMLTLRTNKSPLLLSRNLDADTRGRAVAAVLGPTRVPALYNWTVSLAGCSMIGLFSSLYFLIFFSCMGELGFWLFNLRLKMEICHLLLKFYDYLLDLDRGRDLSGGAAADSRLECVNRVLNELSGTTGEIVLPDGMSEKIDGPTPTCILNMGTGQVFRYALSSNASRSLMYRWYARRLIAADMAHADRRRQGRAAQRRAASQEAENRPSDTFLMTAYLEFRLLLEQIDACRRPINLISTIAILHSVNMIFISMLTDKRRTKVSFVVIGFTLINLCLVCASVFESQSTKIVRPVYAMLALTSRSNKAVRHLSTLWQRSLNDMVGPRTKFCFRLVSLRITYASTLQVNLAIVSLYLLTLDRFEHMR